MYQFAVRLATWLQGRGVRGWEAIVWNPAGSSRKKQS